MKTIDKQEINPYDLNSVAKNLIKNEPKKFTVIRGNDPYNAGAVIKALSSNQEKQK